MRFTPRTSAHVILCLEDEVIIYSSNNLDGSDYNDFKADGSKSFNACYPIKIQILI